MAAKVGVRSICFFIGAIVILAVLYSSTSLPATATARFGIPSTNPEFGEKFKDEQPAPAQDPIAEDSPTTNPPTAALGVPDATLQSSSSTTPDAATATDDASPSTATATGTATDGAEADTTASTSAPANPYAVPSEGSEFNDNKYMFQLDLEYKIPKFDAHHLRRFMPQNYKGPGHPTFATYLSTRNGTLHDPYYQAALQLTYRILWDPRSRSEKYPLTVFVAPFVPDEHRDILIAAGAIVRELDLVEWHPTIATFGRWKDLFSKLNMWRQMDYSRIAFLDLDAFPFQNIDGIFDIATRQKCNVSMLPQEDEARKSEICDYVFTGTESLGEINVGVMVFEPNMAMHERLAREAKHTEKFDNFMAEQAFLGYAFKQDGPFPAQYIAREWNGFFPQPDEEHKLKIVHEKLWSENDHLPWGKKSFIEAWDDMITLYESDAFRELRENEGRRPF